MHEIKRVLIYPILISCVAVKVWFAGRFRLFDAAPDVLIPCVIFLGLYYEQDPGLEFGLAAGFLNDIFSLNQFGVGILGYGIIGFLSGLLQEKFYKENPLTQGFLSFSAAILFSIAEIHVKRWYIPGADIIFNPIPRALAHAAYTAMISPVVFLIMYKLLKVETQYP